MEGKLFKVRPADPAHPREATLEAAVEVIESGGVVALPTETLYGLAADGLNGPALVRVNRLKQKADDAPVLLLLAGIEQIDVVCDRLPELFRPIAERFWPGPLTLVVPARGGLPVQVSHAGTVAVRVPGLALPRRVAAKVGRPISGVSANRTGQPACRRALDVAQVFGDEIDLILDGGPTSAGASSTILDLSGPEPRIVRDGILPRSAIRPFLPGG